MLSLMHNLLTIKYSNKYLVNTLENPVLDTQKSEN